jgi:hypothetical protein
MDWKRVAPFLRVESFLKRDSAFRLVFKTISKKKLDRAFNSSQVEL